MSVWWCCWTGGCSPSGTVPCVLGGLPPADRVVGPWREVRIRVEDFFARHGIGASV